MNNVIEYPCSVPAIYYENRNITGKKFTTVTIFHDKLPKWLSSY
jgi:hypothetical protein